MASERRPTFYIPPNYKMGIEFLGKNYPTANIVQAAVFAIGSFLFSFYLLPFLSTVVKLSIGLSLAILLGFVGLNGIEGETVIQHLRTVSKYKKNRRTAYYNPRVKSEAKPSIFEPVNNKNLLPKEKVALMYEKYKENQAKKSLESATTASSTQVDLDNMFFQDDEGIVDTPFEYMTKKERKKYLKNKKVQAKEERRRKKHEETE